MSPEPDAPPIESLEPARRAAIVARVRDTAVRILVDPLVLQARAAAADAAKLVITSADVASATVDRKKQLRAGRKAIEDWRKKVLEFPKAIETAVREALKADDAAFDAAYTALGTAETRWMLAERDRVAKETAAREEAARTAAQETATAAAAAGVVDDTPDPAIARPAAPRIARGGTGTSSLVSRCRVELRDAVTYAAVDPGGLALTPATVAKLEEAMRGWKDGKPPAELGAIELPDGQGYVAGGVRYYLQHGSATR